ncbi:DUF4403 family protein [Catenovulum maritimum]|uniref:DUF4403 family protein n=1 Tax=Catenovulum maritimum TaxID=1513271 RepID=A0A0J8GRQ9_9ALTE|nr:DUF4403 family protein [Catenovulum maritimum]KMT63984.1 hypothetical protein XM47_16905 [Catenovulum maritimum]
MTNSNNQSTVSMPIEVSLEFVEAKLNDALPDLLADINEPNRICVKNKFIKLRCDLNGWVKRNGEIKLAGFNDALHFSIPIKAQVSAKAGISETVNAAATVYIIAKPKLNADWSLSVEVNPDYKWDKKPSLELFGLIKISFAKQVDPQIRAKMNEFVAEIPEMLANLKLRRQVELAWQKIQEPVEINDNPKLNLLFSPNLIGYSGLAITQQAIKTTINVSGHTDVFLGEVEAQHKAPLLDISETKPLNQGSFSLGLPLVIPYQEMLDAINQKLPNGYEKKLDNEGKLKVYNPDIQSSANGLLAIKLTLEYDNRSRFLRWIDVFNWFSFKGTIAFEGKPSLNKLDRSITLDSLEYQANTDNSILDGLVSVARIEMIREYIKQKARYSFGDKVDEGIAKVNKALNKPTDKDVKVLALLENISVDNLVVNQDSLVVDTRLSGLVSVKVEP